MKSFTSGNRNETQRNKRIPNQPLNAIAIRPTGLTTSFHFETRAVDDRLTRQAAPIVDAFFGLLAGFKPLPKSPLAVATTYAANQRQALRRYLEDGRLAIDNNAVERGIRPLGIGRNNWGFAGSEDGARAAAVMMSLLHSARACHLNPWLYLKDILDRIHTHPPDRLADLLPAHWQPLPENADLGVPLRVHPHPDQALHRPV
jgi:hypothetical protein